MAMQNDSLRTRRELLINLIRAFEGEDRNREMDRIPYLMRPRGHSPSRCCIYLDRAILRYRLISMLGFAVEADQDDFKPVSEYCEEAMKREKAPAEALSLLGMACHACVKSQYMVTDACQGCFARPCVFVCPKQATSVRDGHSHIDHTKCIDCGKCTQVCPYHAIIRIPIPCEEACPVGALSKNPDGTEKIDFSKCIACGKCMKACPFGAIMERSHIIDVLKHIRAGRHVIAMVAPAISGHFPGTLGQIASALKAVGFSHMEEVAFGAEMTADHETKEFFERMERGDRLMTSSCCPAYVEAVRRHVKELLPYVSSTPSPMVFAGREVKKRYPDSVTVFIGPCLAKRREAAAEESVDYVMTFEELASLFAAKEIDVTSCPEEKLDRQADPYARGFATSCGVTAALLNAAANDPECKEKIQEMKVDTHFIDGITKKTLTQLKLYGMGKLPGNFLEVMACEGGCVGGPCALCDVKLATVALKRQPGASSGMTVGKLPPVPEKKES